MFCTNCGKVIDDDAIHCVHCGAKVGEEPVAEQPQPQTIYIQQPQPIYVVPQQPEQEKPKENIFAIVALIASCVGTSSLILSLVGLGIVSGFVGLALNIIGVVFGFLGLKEAKKSGKGKGLSIAGIVVGFVGVLLNILVVVICVVVPILVFLLPIIVEMIVYLIALLGFASLEETAMAVIMFL